MSDNDHPEELRRGSGAGDPARALSSIELQKQAFLALSSELTRILSDLSRKVADASERLRETELEIARKRGELETVHEIEISVEALGRLREEQRLERENLERLRAEQTRVREAEQAEARRRFEEELQSLRKRAMERHEASEKEFERREEVLAGREREAARLLGEVEMLLGRIALRARPAADPLPGGLRGKQEERGRVQ
ncbi:MAG: hypothetical protein JXP48_14685 [Acidobacteria bacterium]|nr:hypothetical protein [Acidobacteriota bacterium]